jgi:hypothetical protein
VGREYRWVLPDAEPAPTRIKPGVVCRSVEGEMKPNGEIGLTVITSPSSSSLYVRAAGGWPETMPSYSEEEIRTMPARDRLGVPKPVLGTS